MTTAKPKAAAKPSGQARTRAKSKASATPTNGKPTHFAAEMSVPDASSAATNGAMTAATSIPFLSFSDSNPTPQDTMDLNQLLTETKTKLNTAINAETAAIAESLASLNDGGKQAAAAKATQVREAVEKLIRIIEAEQAAIAASEAKPTDTALSDAKTLATQLREAMSALVVLLEDSTATGPAIMTKMAAVKLIELKQAAAACAAGLAAAKLELARAKEAATKASAAADADQNDAALQDAATFANGLRAGFDALVVAFEAEKAAIAAVIAAPSALDLQQKATNATQYREALAKAINADKTALALYNAKPDDLILRDEVESAAQALLAFTDKDVLTAKAALTKAIADEKAAIAAYDATPAEPALTKTAAQEAMETAIRLREAMELLINEATVKYTEDELKELAKKDRLIKAGLGVIATITGSLYVLHKMLVHQKMQDLLHNDLPKPLQAGMVNALTKIIDKLDPIFRAFKKFQDKELQGLTNELLDAGVNIGYAIINLAEPEAQADMLKQAEMVSMVAGLVKKSIPLVLASMDMIDISLNALKRKKEDTEPFKTVTDETKKIGEALQAALKAKTALREATYEKNVKAGQRLLAADTKALTA